MFLAALPVNVNNFIAVLCTYLWTVGRLWEQSLLWGEIVAFWQSDSLWIFTDRATWYGGIESASHDMVIWIIARYPVAS